MRTPPARSADLVDPAVRVGELAVLDTDQFLAQAHGDRARGAVADHPLAAGALDLADRRDHGGGTAGEHLGELTGGAFLAPLVGGDLAFFGTEAEIRAQGEERLAGNAG